MADTKITALTAITTVDPAVDVLPIVDVSDTTMAASGTTKKITSNQLLGAGGTATLASATITGDLTVRTNKLVVTSTGAGFGIASPIAPIDVRSNGNTAALFLRTTDPAAAVSSAYIQAPVSTGFSSTVPIYGFWYQNSGMGNPASDTVSLITGSTERYRIDSAGTNTWSNVGGAGTAMTLNSTGLGVGVTPSAWGGGGRAFEIGFIGTGIQSRNNQYSALTQNSWFNSSAQWIYGATGLASRYDQDAGTHKWFVAPSGTAGNAITFTQAMTLDASGNLLLGTTGGLVAAGSRLRVSATGFAAIDAKTTAAADGVADFWNAATTGDNQFVRFWTEATVTSRGSISYNRAGGLVAYNTTSDYRAKDIIGPVSNSGSLIDSLKVYIGKMKGATIQRPMLIAHEAQEVAPYAVTGTKDEVDADGKDKYQQMDVSSFVPLLIAEIQSLRARVQTLEAR